MISGAIINYNSYSVIIHKCHGLIALYGLRPISWIQSIHIGGAKQLYCYFQHYQIPKCALQWWSQIYIFWLYSYMVTLLLIILLIFILIFFIQHSHCYILFVHSHCYCYLILIFFLFLYIVFLFVCSYCYCSRYIILF